MTIRETAISKLHQLPESLLQEVTDFIDFIAHKHQSQIIEMPWRLLHLTQTVHTQSYCSANIGSKDSTYDPV
jgi:hypothetical protein